VHLETICRSTAVIRPSSSDVARMSACSSLVFWAIRIRERAGSGSRLPAPNPSSPRPASS